MSLERALRVSREIRSVDSSQGPGATFPKMSQVPVLSEGSRTKARCGESRGCYLQALLELQKMAETWVMDIHITSGNWAFLYDTGG